jgi:hypothetical protein
MKLSLAIVVMLGAYVPAPLFNQLKSDHSQLRVGGSFWAHGTVKTARREQAVESCVL